MRGAPLFPVPCMDALMPRARTCSPTRFARSSCLMTGAGAATQGYFLLLVPEKVAKENDTPDGAPQPCAPQALGPALILRGIPAVPGATPLPSDTPAAPSVARRSAARTHVKCVREYSASPLRGAVPKPCGARVCAIRGPQENHTSQVCASVAFGVPKPLGHGSS